MAQRLAAGRERREAVATCRDQLAMLHKMLVYAMKCKQTTDQLTSPCCTTRRTRSVVPGEVGSAPGPIAGRGLRRAPVRPRGARPRREGRRRELRSSWGATDTGQKGRPPPTHDGAVGRVPAPSTASTIALAHRRGGSQATVGQPIADAPVVGEGESRFAPARREQQRLLSAPAGRWGSARLSAFVSSSPSDQPPTATVSPPVLRIRCTVGPGVAHATPLASPAAPSGGSARI